MSVAAPRVQSQLSNVQETLLMPLYFRARETKRPDGIIRDPRAVEIVESIDYDFQKFDPIWNLQLDVAIRTEVFDERVRDFTRRHPSGAIINLGAGLDGRFLRLDNGKIRWWDLDLPDSLKMRREFYNESDRNRFIASSCFDYEWFDSVDLSRNVPMMVIAEGLFCYCDESSVRELFGRLADRWPGCEIVFQSICPSLVGQERLVPVIAKTGALFRWGIHDGREVCQWNSDYRFIGQWHLVDRHRSRWKSIRYRTWLPWHRRWFREVMKITQIGLGQPVALAGFGLQ